MPRAPICKVRLRQRCASRRGQGQGRGDGAAVAIQEQPFVGHAVVVGAIPSLDHRCCPDAQWYVA